MDNVIENQEIKSNAYLFAISTKSSSITSKMAQLIIWRWTECGKPLFLIPKDLKERILASGISARIRKRQSRRPTESDVKALLLRRRRQSMQMEEFNFMMEKFNISFASNLCIKKAAL
jgi:hypothetical protein